MVIETWQLVCKGGLPALISHDQDSLPGQSWPQQLVVQSRPSKPFNVQEGLARTHQKLV